MKSTSKTIRFSIADDHKIFRDGIKMSLGSVPYLKFVWEAENGKMLIEKLQHSMPDILLLDIRMPLLDGIEALPIIRNDFSDLKIIVLSMYDDQLTIRKMIDLGANAYLTKTAEPEEIINAVNGCMEDEIYINQIVTSSVLHQLNHKKITRSFLAYPARLTEKEIEILRLIAADKTTEEISELVFLSPRTVEKIRHQMKQKTGVRSIAGLVMYGLRNNLL